VLVQEGKLACTRFPPWWNDDQDALALVQEGKIPLAIFPPRWNDTFPDVLVLV
jgi:hypothetical protein